MLDGLPSLEIPAIRALAAFDQWVLWRQEVVAGRVTKVPYSTNGQLASTTNKATWASLRDCAQRLVTADKPYDGVGFVLDRQSKSQIIGVDLDKCIDLETGAVEPWAAKLIKEFNTYTEISPSGRGIRMFGKGVLAGHRRRQGRMEVYDNARYLTVTGKHFPGTPEDMADIADAAARLVLRMDAEKGAQAPGARVDTANGERTSLTRPADELETELEPHAVDTADAPTKKLEALRQNVKRFDETWGHARKDAKDWSDSEYDLAAASFMVRAGWNNVEVMQGLIQFRRQHGAGLKLNRQPKCDYYARTIRAARRQNIEDDAQEKLNKQSLEQLDVLAMRDQVMDSLSTIFGVRIIKIMKYESDDPVYQIVTERGDIRGSISMIMNQQAFRNAFADVTKNVLRKVKAKAYDERAQAILSAAESVTSGPDGYMTAMVSGWLGEYCAEHAKDTRLLQSDSAIIEGIPFVEENEVFVSTSHFLQWVFRRRGQKVEPKRLAVVMREIGCETREKHWKLDGAAKSTRKNYWAVPGRLFH